jgi:O-antigen ligase
MRDGNRLGETFDVITAILYGGRADDFSVSIRLTLYEIGWAAFLEAPWFGHGWDDLPAVIGQHISPNTLRRIGFVQFHSDIVNFAVGAGIVGILSYLAMLVAPFAGVLASPRDKYFRARFYAITCVVAGYAVCGVSDIVIGYDLPTISYGLFVAVFLGVLRERPEPI